MINGILISYGCVIKRSSKPIMKGSRVEREKNIKNYWRKGGKKLIDSIVLKKNGE